MYAHLQASYTPAGLTAAQPVPQCHHGLAGARLQHTAPSKTCACTEPARRIHTTFDIATMVLQEHVCGVWPGQGPAHVRGVPSRYRLLPLHRGSVQGGLGEQHLGLLGCCAAAFLTIESGLSRRSAAALLSWQDLVAVLLSQNVLLPRPCWLAQPTLAVTPPSVCLHRRLYC